VPPPPDVGPRVKALLEPAADRGLADAQWMLGTLLLRGTAGVSKDTPLAEALLRRAAERGNPGAAFQLGLALLSPNDGLSPDRREAVVWISRSAARGQKEAQDLLESARESARTPGPAK
jgi:TPR repeat protein